MPRSPDPGVLRPDIRVQEVDFSMQAEWERLRSRLAADAGAVAAFVGLVRELRGETRTSLTLEHYPGMTEKSIAAIAVKAAERWRLAAVTVVHRVGRLRPTDQIVLVLTVSRHRAEALAACEFIIDCLKTDAIFWKREAAAGASHWVQATAADQDRATAWNSPTAPSPGVVAQKR